MGTLRHIVKRRVHLERHQPAARKRLGLLEKKKDYLERARDYHKKRDHLAHLQEKARSRNPDEFYHKMIHTEMADGKFKKKLSKAHDEQLTKEEQMLAESSDLNYIMSRANHEKRRVEKLEENLHMLEVAAKSNKSIVFESDSDSESEDEGSFSDDDDDSSSKKPSRGKAGAKATALLSAQTTMATATSSSSSRNCSSTEKTENSEEKEQEEEFSDSESEMDWKEEERLRKQAKKLGRRNRLAAYKEVGELRKREDKLYNVANVLVNRLQAKEKGKKQTIKLENGKIQYKFQSKRKR